MATSVFIAIIKNGAHFDALLYTCLHNLSVSDFENTELSCALGACFAAQVREPMRKNTARKNQYGSKLDLLRSKLEKAGLRETNG